MRSETGALIGLDWGTSSLRAYLLNIQGDVLAVEQRPWGIMQLPPVEGLAATTPETPIDRRRLAFEHAFSDACGAWLSAQPHLPILACGMVGSAQGWQEARYLETPTSLPDLALHLTRVELAHGRTLHIVPGLIQRGALPNVMRGEETQVLGILSQPALASAAPLWIGLPGTHSKWVTVAAQGIASFDTFMTGEVFSALRHHTILGRTMQAQAGDAPPDDAAFLQGLEVARSNDGALGVLSNIFSTRTLGLTGQLHATAQADYLSGLLIGHEIAALARRPETRPATIALCGEPDLCRRYAMALQHYAFAKPVTVEHATVLGLWQIAVAAGLVQEAHAKAGDHND